MIEIALTHHYPDFRLEVDFRANPGVTAIFGPSGAGKTTLLRAVAGLIRPDQGRIRIGEQTVFDSARAIHLPPERRRIGFVFQDARLFPHMTVRDNLLYGARRRRGAVSEIDRITDMLGLGGLLSRVPAHLSGGEASRVGLGRALLSNPALLILDEPLAALDAARRAEILPYLERLKTTALPILYISHSTAEVARLADALVTLDHGRQTHAGGVEALFPATAPLTGQEAAAILSGQVRERDGPLAVVDTALGVMRLMSGQEVGARVALRVRAGDVMLSLDPPGRISALNILSVRVGALCPSPDGHVTVTLTGEGSGADAAILAQITRHSAQTLGLTAGQPVYALIKSVALA